MTGRVLARLGARPDDLRFLSSWAQAQGGAGEITWLYRNFIGAEPQCFLGRLPLHDRDSAVQREAPSVYGLAGEGALRYTRH